MTIPWVIESSAFLASCRAWVNTWPTGILEFIAVATAADFGVAQFVAAVTTVGLEVKYYLYYALNYKSITLRLSFLQ